MASDRSNDRRLVITGLPRGTQDDEQILKSDLKDIFSKYGKIVECHARPVEGYVPLVCVLCWIFFLRTWPVFT